MEPRWHAPCRITKTDFSQLASRYETGFLPHVSFGDPVPEALNLASFINQFGMDTTIALKGDLKSDDKGGFGDQLDYIAQLREHSDHVLPYGCLKVGGLFENNPVPGSLESPNDAPSVLDAYKAKKEAVHQAAAYAAKHGITLLFENDPRPDFAKWREPLQKSAEPRWQGAWCPVPEFVGRMLCSPEEVEYFFHGLDNVGLQLDFEHMCTAQEYGSVFSFDHSTNGKLTAGDLSADLRKTAERFLGQVEDERVLFDYSELTAEESDMLLAAGYVVRKGMIPVARSSYELEEMTRAFMDAATVATITPGFQMSYVVDDIRSDEVVRIDGSHHPGIHFSYIHDASVRDELLSGLADRHRMLGSLMREYGIQNIEIEPHFGLSGPVYQGPEWQEGVLHAKEQLNELLVPHLR